MSGDNRGFHVGALRVVALLVSWGVSCLPTDAARAAPTIETVAVGVAGVYRTDRWCPVELRVAGIETDGEYRVDIDAVDSAGRRIRHSATHRLSAGVDNPIAQLIQVGRADEPVEAALRNAKGDVIATARIDLARLAEPLADDESLTVVIGRLTGLEGVEALATRTPQRPRYRRIAGLAQLPPAERLTLVDRSLVLDAVSTIVWMAGQSPEAKDRVAGDQLQLLDDWVRAGGRLVLALGPHAAQTLRDSALAAGLNLGPLDERTELHQPTPLEAFVGNAATASPARSNANADERPFRLEIARVGPVEGKIAAAASQTEGTLPLIVRAPHGFGEVAIVAFDLSDPALVAWSGHTRLVAQVLALGDADAPAEEIERPSSSAWSGKAYSSLSEQLADSLDQFPGASPERFWYLTAAAVAYILVIGPLDWYLVRRRPEWTWATFLGTVWLAAAGAYAVAHATKSNDVLVNQLRLVDVDLTMENAARMRAVAWSSVYQPTAGVYDMALESPRLGTSPAEATHAPGNEVVADPPRLSLWSRTVAQGNSFGLLTGRFDAREPAAKYDAARGRIAHRAFPAWSSQLLVARSLADVPASPSGTLAPDAFGRVVGSVRNPLDEPLEQTVLLFGASALALGTLTPGQAVAVDNRGDWRPVESYLTRQSLAQDRATAEKYDPNAVDLSRIGEVVGFYDAAGGRNYTGLDNRGTADADLSRQLRLGRAVLMGRTSTAAPVEISPGTSAAPHRQTTWWRFLLKPSATLAPGG